MTGQCSICRQEKEELEHLNLYVSGSEGIWVCLGCRITLTNVASGMQSAANRAAIRNLRK